MFTKHSLRSKWEGLCHNDKYVCTACEPGKYLEDLK